MIDQLYLEQAYLADHERRTRIMNAWRAYENQLPKPLKVEPGTPDDNILLGFGQTVVEKGRSFLFPDGISFEVDGQAKSDADTWLKACWDSNRLMSTLLDIGTNGGVCGDVFLRLKPAKSASTFPRVVVLDPANITVVTDEDDYTEVLAYVNQWNTISHATRKPVVRRQVIERDDADSTRWTITDYEGATGGQWIVRREPTPWPYDWAPIFHCQNLPAPNSYHGYSDLESALVDLNKALNFNVSNTGRILRHHAHPKTVVTGINAPLIAPNSPGQRAMASAGVKPFDIGADGVIKLANPDAKVWNLEMQSDLASSIEFYRELKSLFHEISRIPEVATGKVSDLGQLSGLALQILYQPLLEKTRDKRILYGELLINVSVALLQLWRKSANHLVKIHWPALLPSDPKSDAETALLDQQLGASTDTLLTKRGYNPADEAAKRAKEKADAKALGAGLLDGFDKGQDPGADPNADPAGG